MDEEMGCYDSGGSTMVMEEMYGWGGFLSDETERWKRNGKRNQKS